MRYRYYIMRVNDSDFTRTTKKELYAHYSMRLIDSFIRDMNASVKTTDDFNNGFLF